jgi:hypothetical protein
MPRYRVRKRTRGMWSEIAMSQAIVEYNSGTMKLARSLVSQEIHYAERQQNTVTTTAEALWRVRERQLWGLKMKRILWNTS